MLEAPIKVYNFEVENYHTYFVGENGVLVHNMCAKSTGYDRVQKIGKRNGNTPQSNQAQNKQFNYVVKELKLNNRQARRLHDKITKKGYGKDQIMAIAKELFKKG